MDSRIVNITIDVIVKTISKAFDMAIDNPNGTNEL